MSNYPDDIRMYDHDPRSPFYVDPVAYCEECDQELKDHEDQLCDRCEEAKDEQ